MRLVVTGGRAFDDFDAVYRELDAINAETPVSLLIEGGADGVDSIAKLWATARFIPVETYLAEWKTHGRSAGPRRNQRMIDEGKPDAAAVFPGGRGTADMTRRIKAAGIPILNNEPMP